MTIKIHRPELESLILERLKSGEFKTIEDMLMQTLRSSPLPAGKKGATGADLIAAIQASPYREIELQPRHASPGSTFISAGIRDHESQPGK